MRTASYPDDGLPKDTRQSRQALIFPCAVLSREITMRCPNRGLEALCASPDGAWRYTAPACTARRSATTDPKIGSGIEGMTMLSPSEIPISSDNDLGVEGAETGFWLIILDAPLPAR